MRETKHRGSPTFCGAMPFQGLRPRNGSGLTFTFIVFRLFAVAATLLLALVAASSGTGSRLVAFCEDHVTPQGSLVTSRDVTGRELAFLDGSPSGSSN